MLTCLYVRLARGLRVAVLIILAWIAPAVAQAALQVSLSNGFDMVCDHISAAGSETRLYMDAGTSNYIAVSSAEIVSTLALPAPLLVTAPANSSQAQASASPMTGGVLDAGALHQMLTGAGAMHDVDVDLLMSVVDAESARRVNARSRAGAEGLMQLMPDTARQLGVENPLAPRQNVNGGTAYLDQLLRRYHDNLALALAAYNAGPAAVDRWHGIPPYRETRAYVARIIHEFNRRYTARQAAALALAQP